MIQANQKNDLAVDLEKAFKKAKTNTLISKVSMELKKEFSMSFVDSDARKHNETWSRLAS